MTEKPLYKDRQIKIDYLPTSPEDHLLWIKDEANPDLNHIIQRGILPELARTPIGGIEQKIANFNIDILTHLKIEGISIDSLHIAICQAYHEQEERYHLNYMHQQRENSD